MEIVVIDSSYLTYKSFYALKNKHLFVKKDGEKIITSAVFGFVREVINLTTKYKYNFIICAWDAPPYIKKTKVSSYKERPRTDTPELISEKEIIKAIMFDLNIPSIIAKGYEGEEVAASIIDRLNDNKIDLYTNDEDCYALISNRTSIVNSKDASLIRFKAENLNKKYKVTPEQFTHFKTLTGCKSDHISGVEGIGPVYASWLINKFGTISGIMENIDRIEKEKPKIAEKIIRSMKDRSIMVSKYLVKINRPKKLLQIIPSESLTYNEILEYLEANSFLRGSNLIALKFIKKNQRKLIKKIRKVVKWKN